MSGIELREPLRGSAALRCLAMTCVTLGACGSKSTVTSVSSTPRDTHVVSAGDPLVALLPEHPQVVVEIDLARLRKNAVVGALVDRIAPVRFAHADVVVLAAYGVGTADAVMLTLVSDPTQVGAGDALREGLIRDGVVAVGPPAWIEQIEARAAIPDVKPAKELLDLRDHAVPAGAPGASLRVVAQLSFDARIALARMTGLEAAPERLSIWGDVVDDLAIVIDADGGKDAKATQTMIRGALASLAEEPAARVMGVRQSIESARMIAHAPWVRAILAVGPEHLKRAVARAEKELPAPEPSTPPPSSAPPN